MYILITGGFGSVGLSITNELLQRGHRVRVMELASKKRTTYEDICFSLSPEMVAIGCLWL